MRVASRFGVVAAVIVMTLGAPAPVDAARAEPLMSSATTDFEASMVKTPDDDRATAAEESDGSPLRPLLGLLLIVIVFVVGLRAVKRQRDEGRRSKLPPIG